RRDDELAGAILDGIQLFQSISFDDFPFSRTWLSAIVDCRCDNRRKGVHSAATPAASNISGPSPLALPSFAAVSALAFIRRSKLSHTVFQSPRVAALEYSVARVSKKLACSTPLSIGASQGSGCSSTM